MVGPKPAPGGAGVIEDDHQIPAAAYTGTVFSDFLEHTTHAVSQAGLATSHAAGDPLVDHIIRVLGQSGANDTIFRPANGNPFDHFDYAALPDFLTIHSPEYLLFRRRFPEREKPNE